MTSRPPTSEIPTTPRSQSQQSPTHTPIVHVPNPGTVERYVQYKKPRAIKTVRLQPQLNRVHIHDTEYTQLPSLQLPSKLNSTTSSKIYPALKRIRKSSTLLSNRLDNSSGYTPSQESTTSLFFSFYTKTLHRYFNSQIFCSLKQL